MVSIRPASKAIVNWAVNGFSSGNCIPARPHCPRAIAAEIAALEVSHADPAKWLAEVNAQYKLINAMSDGADKEQARKALNDRGNRLAYEAIRRDLLRAIYSPAQLQEQMVLFWLNHFSVFQYKANLRWLVGDYEERAIRPHVLRAFQGSGDGESANIRPCCSIWITIKMPRDISTKIMRANCWSYIPSAWAGATRSGTFRSLHGCSPAWASMSAIHPS